MSTPAKDARTVLLEWFRSGKRRLLSATEKKMLKDMPLKEYGKLYDEVQRITAEEKRK